MEIKKGSLSCLIFTVILSGNSSTEHIILTFYHPSTSTILV
ncbi:hypothetical protein MSP8886_03781 [Marinomonas spartinae]|uniref:Uncharacterized protein n=1 Tax=Marinomonas spartinae TaxID=1792290 RepID=A0A1A8TU08_9GAMM|nr:hypothetical protein [Marinomonas spartinae]SBS36614.1 hypothetical protein MSP8886_03781 [Marinomonas spartinae]